MNKVLIITYYWTPSGGAGVQRWLKFAKFLPEFGWEPIVLSVDPEYVAYPVTDYSLADDLPLSVKIHRTPAIDYFSIYKKDKSKIPSAGFANNVDNTFKGKVARFIRGNFFIPDPRKGWNRFAFKKACEIIETEGVKHVITTSPPHSTQLIGLELKKRYPGLHWIADLRDPWTDIYYYDQFFPTFISKKIDKKHERDVLRSADKILTVGASLKTLFSSKVKGIENKIHVLTNGFDEADFEGLVTTRPERYTISYIGTLSDSYPIKGFLEAVGKLQEEGSDFLLRFAGAVSQNQKNMVLSEVRSQAVEFTNYVTHANAISYMIDSSLLLIIIPDHHSNKSIITGKLFEYLAAGRPILCLGPLDGDAAGIIDKLSGGVTIDYNNTEAIYSFIKETFKNTPFIQNSDIREFSRLNITKHLVEVLK